MSAHLYPGIKSLHLVLDTPYDLIRTSDIRDDIAGVKVWVSNTSGFDPIAGQGTLAFDGLSLSITIPNLETNKTYYVKYAFISAIDPTTYTVSSELSATVYDENVKVYGYLTNDPTGIATAADGTGGNFSLATGTFKVYNLSQDVTGNGPTYSIKANSTYHILGATINQTTGVYSCTDMDADSGSVTFLATYNEITIEQVWNVYKGIAGAHAPLIQLSATNSDFIFKDQFATTPVTTQTEITATLKNVTGTPTFTATGFTREGVQLGTVEFTQTDNKIVITGNQFAALGTTLGTVQVTATLGTVSDTYTLYRINDGTEQITVELSNSAHVIPAANNGDTLPANYTGSGTIIKVKQGNTYLPVDSTSPYDSVGTWNIFDITSSNITCDPTPTIGYDYVNFDTHAAMTADQAYIDYTIYYRTTTGQVGTQTVRQSFSKTKAGISGTVVTISQESPGHVYNTEGLAPTPATQTLTATLFNYNPAYTYYYEFIVDGISKQNSTNNTYLYSAQTNYNDMPDYVYVKVRKGSVSGTVVAEDELVIVGVKAGSNALISWIKNPLHSFPVNAQGEIDYSNSGCEIMVAEGTTVLVANNSADANMPSGTFKVSATGDGHIQPNSTPTYSGNVVVYGNHNTVTADASKITYTITVKTLAGKIMTLTQQQNFVLKRDGKDAINTATVYLYKRNSSITTAPTFSPQTTMYNFSTGVLDATFGWYQTIPPDNQGTVVWVVQALAKSDPGSYSDTILASEWSTPTILSKSVQSDPLRNATGYLYWSNQQDTAPAAPGASGYNFATGTFDNLTAGWSTTFNAPSSATTKLWAARYNVQETVYNEKSSQVINISNVFTHQNFSGLVTFTTLDQAGYQTSTQVNSAINNTITNGGYITSNYDFANSINSKTTTIDGAKITTGSISAERLQIGSSPQDSNNYIRLYNNKIEVWSGGVRRVIIGNLG